MRSVPGRWRRRAVGVGQQDRAGIGDRDAVGRRRASAVLGRGHVVGVERAGDGERDDPRARRGSLRPRLASASSAPAATIWPAPLRLAGVRPHASMPGDDLVRVAAEQGRHPGRASAQAAAISGRAAPRGRRRSPASARRRVRRRSARRRCARRRRARRRPAQSSRPTISAEGDDQRLGDRGVLDLLGVGGRAEPGQVEPGDLGEPLRPGRPTPGSSSHGVSMPGVCEP